MKSKIDSKPMHGALVGAIFGLVGAIASVVGYYAYRCSATALQLSYGWSVAIGILASVMFGLVAYRPSEVLKAFRVACRVASNTFHSWKQTRTMKREERLAWLKDENNIRAIRRGRLSRQAKTIANLFGLLLILTWTFPTIYLFVSVHNNPMTVGAWYLTIILTLAALLICLVVGFLMSCEIDWKKTDWELRVSKINRFELRHDVAAHDAACKDHVIKSCALLLVANPVVVLPAIICSAVYVLGLFVLRCIQSLVRFPSWCRAVWRFICAVAASVAEFFVTMFCYLNTTARAAICTCSVVGFCSGLVAEHCGATILAPLWGFGCGLAFGLVERWAYVLVERPFRRFLIGRRQLRTGL